MYSESIKDILFSRIGFGTPQENGFSLVIDEANSLGLSGRLFRYFHSLVTIENINGSIDNQTADSAQFNVILLEIKKNAVLEILPLILDKHSDYDPLKDYDLTIESNITLFDDAIGYKVAINCLEMFLSTKRSNFSERNVKLSASNLKLELEGFRNDNGVLVAQGLVQKFNRSIKDARAKIFPFTIKVNDASNNW